MDAAEEYGENYWTKHPWREIWAGALWWVLLIRLVVWPILSEAVVEEEYPGPDKEGGKDGNGDGKDGKEDPGAGGKDVDKKKEGESPAKGGGGKNNKKKKNK